jgi:hypothetical protein
MTSSIICPEVTCRAMMSSITICHYLLEFGSDKLLNEYLKEQQWQGKSEEWIKRFAARCPGCQCPIEKNGGCDEMLCNQCQTHFYWSKARRIDEHGVYRGSSSCQWTTIRSILLLLLSLFILLVSYFSFV